VDYGFHDLESEMNPLKAILSFTRSSGSRSCGTAALPCPLLAAVRYSADRHQVEYDKAPISETSAPDAKRSNRMDFTIGLNISEDGKILIHIRIPEDEGFTINEAERFRDLLDKQITVARSMSDGAENTRRFRQEPG
jgi:hypothetical protein